MQFNSYEFLLFLPIVFGLYWLSRGSRRLQNVVLLIASYTFYAWWNVQLLALIVGVTAAGYCGGLLTAHYGAHSRASRRAAIAVIIACLALLGWFKYYDFFALSTNRLIALLHLSHNALPIWHIVLPVGISFYTFQVLSYTIDVHRGHLKPCRDVIAFAAFVSFFPQLVAGPIERATHLLPQLTHDRTFRYAEAVDGLRLMLWGFVKKVVIADTCAPVVQLIYADAAATGPALWWATFLFAFQIYGDFSGYSDMAVGMARLFGIHLTTNFRLPYFSRSMAEFWQRWHITLNAWFRDYVYIPLGGSRCGRYRTLLHVVIVFLLSGLWHGANWTFIAWGAFLAACFVPLVLGHRRKYAGPVTWQQLPQVLLTLFCVLIGWVFFRSDSIRQALSHLHRMFTDLQFSVPPGGRMVILYPLALILVEWITQRWAHPLSFTPHSFLGKHRVSRWLLYYSLILLVLYHSGSREAFIYFQF